MDRPDSCGRSRRHRAMSRPPLPQEPRQDQPYPAPRHEPDSKGGSMTTKTPALSLSDVLGLGRLAADAAHGLTGLVEHMHMSILDAPGFAPLGQGVTGGVTRLVYRGVRGAFHLTGKGVGAAAALVDGKADERPVSRR